MIKPDIFIEIDFDMDEPTKTVIKTNAKREVLDELLEAWLQDQIWAKRPDKDCYVALEPTNNDHYLIRIGLVLKGDVFYTNHNCDNHALEVGIIHAGVRPQLDGLQVVGL